MLLTENFKHIALFTLIALATALKSLSANAAPQETLTVAGGCFWCVEADFENVPGVTEAVSGFAGGDLKNPSYKQVTNGNTGHYEVVQITFDPSKVSRAQLLAMFFRSIDPTDSGGQFCDRGDSYRTAIFVSNKAEKAIAKQAKSQAQADLGQPIVTPILNAVTFYPADASHQDYYKGTSLVFTRFGPKRQRDAYKLYRKSCGRDQRVRDLWGAAAPFTGS